MQQHRRRQQQHLCAGETAAAFGKHLLPPRSLAHADSSAAAGEKACSEPRWLGVYQFSELAEAALFRRA